MPAPPFAPTPNFYPVPTRGGKGRAGRRFLTLALVLASALGVGGCEDPVLRDRIAALGDEEPGVPVGPLHRPGQPCLLCHASGGTAPRYTVAGTVYRTPMAPQPLGGVAVRLIDAARRSFTAYTNCAGNFYVSAEEYQPTLPLWASLSGHGLSIDMESPMNKDGDCASCHQGAKSPSSAGHVYLTDDPARSAMLPVSTCGGGSR